LRNLTIADPTYFRNVKTLISRNLQTLHTICYKRAFGFPWEKRKFNKWVGFLALLQLEMFVIVEYFKYYPVVGYDPWTVRTPYKSGKWKLLCAAQGVKALIYCQV